MSKQKVHFVAIGYEPGRMKPVHFATGFFLSLTGQNFSLEWLNKASVTRHKDGLREDYAHENLLSILRDRVSVESSFTENGLKVLRTQINGVTDNDDGVHAAFPPYSTFGNDYTIVSDRFLTSQKRLDGYSGHLAHRVLERSPEGQRVLTFARQCILRHGTPLERLVEPLLDEDAGVTPWNNPYPEKFGDLTEQRLDALAEFMKPQTAAIARLCSNLQNTYSHQTQLRSLVVGLCSWLFLYLQKSVAVDHATPLIVMDFLGGENQRLRTQSRNCFSLQRELYFGSYQKKWDANELDCSEEDFEEVKKTGFKFLEQHFSDLAVRVGFAQPRAAQARRKHFELQPDTARALILSVIEPGEIKKLSDLAQTLRATWGISFGGCDDDQGHLQSRGYTGLDQDADLEPNAAAFVDLLKRLNLANEPSDGLVLCAAHPEALL